MSNLRRDWRAGTERPSAPVIRRITIEERAGNDFDVFVDGDEVMASRLCRDEALGAVAAVMFAGLRPPFLRPAELEIAYRKHFHLEPYEQKEDEVPF